MDERNRTAGLDPERRYLEIYYREPGNVAGKLSVTALRGRTGTRGPATATDTPPRPRLPRIRIHPNGFDIGNRGTFTPGCPVPHTAPQDSTRNG